MSTRVADLLVETLQAAGVKTWLVMMPVGAVGLVGLTFAAVTSVTSNPIRAMGRPC
jgi:hypothetical protein